SILLINYLRKLQFLYYVLPAYVIVLYKPPAKIFTYSCAFLKILETTIGACFASELLKIKLFFLYANHSIAISYSSNHYRI
ncbi:MAG: hypothetical protein ACHQNT_02710, partial [Bacteroidia bacterium]